VIVASPPISHRSLFLNPATPLRMPSRKRAGLELVLASGERLRIGNQVNAAALRSTRNATAKENSSRKSPVRGAVESQRSGRGRLRAGGRARAGRAGGTLSFYELSCLSCSHRSRTIRRNTSASFGSVLGSIGGTVCFQNTRKDARFPRSAGT
jgi:hypothetical protein